LTYNSLLGLRDVEEAYMISPRRRRIAIMGFGRSAPTPPGGITAQIIIVPNFKWLKAKANHGKVDLRAKLNTFIQIL
jgi:hypothetical protein